MNRLLINMKNKIEILHGAIHQCDILENDGTIEINGLHKLTITRGENSKESIIKRRNELLEERQNLINRVCRMDRFY